MCSTYEPYVFILNTRISSALRKANYCGDDKVIRPNAVRLILPATVCATQYANKNSTFCSTYI